MPQPDGYAVCRRLREREETEVLPVIMLTASDGLEKTKAIEAGADDFIAKPFNREELLTRIHSLLRIKRYHDMIKAQAAELLELNQTLEERVRTQVEELERLRRCGRYGWVARYARRCRSDVALAAARLRPRLRRRHRTRLRNVR